MFINHAYSLLSNYDWCRKQEKKVRGAYAKTEEALLVADVHGSVE
jgi:hypothetical protein